MFSFYLPSKAKITLRGKNDLGNVPDYDCFKGPFRRFFKNSLANLKTTLGVQSSAFFFLIETVF